ncbi:MAG: homoserine dehydrogenase [Chthoniobacterales bacterium]
MQKLQIGMAGLGTVGAGVYKNLHRHRELLARRTGVEFEIRKIAVRDLKKPRGVAVPAALITDRLDDLLEDPQIQVIVELMGGIEIPLAFVKKAIKAGKIIVTGNKALLAEHGHEIFELAREHKVPIFYEAAVAGGIPIIKSVREAFVGNHFESIHGIINGTSNYILTRMTETGADFAEALAEAQKLGYAEADPTLDVNGWDAAHKTIILASLAYGFWVDSAGIRVEGVDKITGADIRFADSLGYKIKLLATIKSDPQQNIEVRVVPTLIPKSHVLASVSGVFNAVAVKGDVVGETLFYGRGAGQDPTSSSVIGDLSEAASAALESSQRCYGFTSHNLYGHCIPADDAISEYYLRLAVDDTPGVLARVSNVLGTSQIGISSVIQPEWHEDGPVPLVLIIHDAKFGAVRAAVAEIAKMDCIKQEPTLLNVETFK